MRRLATPGLATVALLALTGACTAPGPSAPETRTGVLSLGARPLGTLTRTVTDERTVTWTTLHRLVVEDEIATRAWVEGAVLDDEGRVERWWRGAVGEPAEATLEVDARGAARWTRGGLSGTWHLPERPWWPLALLDGERSGRHLVWDGRDVAWRPLAGLWLDELRRVPLSVSDGRAWSLGFDDGRLVDLRFPDGSHVLLDDESAEPEAFDPVALYRIEGDALTNPRRLRKLVLRWEHLEDASRPTCALPHDDVVRERPLTEELPHLPVAHPAPVRGSWGLPTAPAPVDLDLPRTDDRLALVEAALAAVRERTTVGRRIGRPDPGALAAGGTGDCDDLAMLLVAGLGHEGLHAEVVQGLLYVDAPVAGWVPHAWVRVPFGDAWLEVDPALAQLPVDAAHVPRAQTPWPPGCAARARIVEAR